MSYPTSRPREREREREVERVVTTHVCLVAMVLFLTFYRGEKYQYISDHSILNDLTSCASFTANMQLKIRCGSLQNSNFKHPGLLDGVYPATLEDASFTPSETHTLPCVCACVCKDCNSMFSLLTHCNVKLIWLSFGGFLCILAFIESGILSTISGLLKLSTWVQRTLNKHWKLAIL